jgi:hypothetical protein
MGGFHLRARWVVWCAIALIMASGLAWGQAGSSTIRGVVTDPHGGVIPDATVKISNPGTGFSRSMNTTGTGTFSFDLILPGTYKIEVEAKGFKRKVVEKVQALVGQTVDASQALEVGQITQVVVVEAGAAAVQVNTQDATLGNNFLPQQMGNLPIEARNIISLLTLQPGVTREGYVAGARSDQSNITLDGVDINEAQTSALGFTGGDANHPVLRLNGDAIAEFRVTTVNANANQGRSSGAQINLVTKSGTNDFHGDVFEFYRSTGFNANDFFNKRDGIDRPGLIRRTFGGAVGGPVIKEKVFFFYSYQGRRDASQESVVRTVPLASMGQGLLRYNGTDGSLVTLSTAQLNQAFPDVKMNPAALAALAAAAAKYPANDFTVGDSLPNRLLNTAGFRFNAPTPVRQNSSVARLDWRINKDQSLFIRGNLIYDLTGQAPQFPDTPPPNLWEHPWGFVVAHTWNLRTNLVNSFRYGITREAFTQAGDSAANDISFRFVFSPLLFQRTLSRETPVHNIVDDVSWVRGPHTFQFGTNIRIVKNSRLSFGSAFDAAITNPSFYVGGGVVLDDALNTFADKNGLPEVDSLSSAENASTAMIGRYTQYTARATFAKNGTVTSSGTATDRTFATKAYDGYFQDAWKVRRNVTLSYGLRYSLSQPVNETNGFEMAPNIPFDQYFAKRLAGAAAGTPFNTPVVLNLSGPANGKPYMYNSDKNNFQPRVAIAWSPGFDKGWLHAIFGGPGKSVIRTGYSLTNDYYGEALAVAFDLNNTIGFVQQFTISANTFDITAGSEGPQFTGYNQNVRSLPNIPANLFNNLTFPLQQPSDLQRRIESSLDGGLQAPTNHVWNVTVERELPAGMLVSASYIGRIGTHLLATRDVMALNNLVDPKTGMDWYTAATILEKIRQTRPSANTAVSTMPYFDNLYPANLRTTMNTFYDNCVQPTDPCIPAGFTPTQTFFWIARNFYANDWTDIQNDVENATGLPFFFQPQYGALSAWGTVANSTYHALAISVRQRFHNNLTWDFNYTYSHSLDDASGLQTSTGFGEAFILNPIRQRDNYASSDFDLRHVINFNYILQLPFGRGQHVAHDIGRGLDALIGGWQLSGIVRWNTGLPLAAPFDDARWATNWNAQSNGSLTRPLQPCVTTGDATNSPKLFGCDPTFAYQSFRNAYPGETGARNIFRLPGYFAMDAGLTKTFQMPYSEKHQLMLRWEVFNVTNAQRFGALDQSRDGYGIKSDPLVRNRTPPSNWSNFTGIQGTPRIMQIGLRYQF